MLKQSETVGLLFSVISLYASNKSSSGGLMFFCVLSIRTGNVF